MIPPKFDNAWGTELKALYTHDMEQYWDKSLSIHQWNQYQNLLHTYFSLIDHSSSLEIMDVGCAQGTLALLLAEQGHTVTAVDIRQDFLDYAQSRHEFGDITFLSGNTLELKIDQKFDLIFANQIVEHLVYPLEMVEGLRELLNDGGRLVMTTPNWHYFKNSLPSFNQLGDPKQWEHLQHSADGDGHFYAYKPTELASIFADAGFKKILSSVFETPFISGHSKFRYAHKILPYAVLSVLDKVALRMPAVNRKIAHQLMIIGTK